MALEEDGLPLLNRLFEESARRHGGDLSKVVREVQAQVAALNVTDRAVVDDACERLLAFRAPDASGALRH